MIPFQVPRLENIDIVFELLLRTVRVVEIITFELLKFGERANSAAEVAMGPKASQQRGSPSPWYPRRKGGPW